MKFEKSQEVTVETHISLHQINTYDFFNLSLIYFWN